MMHPRTPFARLAPIAAFLFTLCSGNPSFAQNCSAPPTGFPPINDLGKGLYRGYQGGLYPNGLNTPPLKHLQEGLRQATQIGTRSFDKNYVAFVTIGMSNTTNESQALKSLLDTFSLKNRGLIFVNCAQSGMDVSRIVDTASPYWRFVQTQLDSAKISARDVQVAWFKEAEMNPTDPVFPHHADTLVGYYTRILQHLRTFFPNLRICYLSSRIYAGYSTSTLNPEPYAYESGWAVKSLIEKQINVDTNLSYGPWNGQGPLKGKVPWLAWGPYLWADGTTPRSDGLTWKCPDDFASDGTHPSSKGAYKVAAMLLDFFSHDIITRGWFLSLDALSQDTIRITSPRDGAVIPDRRDTFQWIAPANKEAIDHYAVTFWPGGFESYSIYDTVMETKDTKLIFDSLPVRFGDNPDYGWSVSAIDARGRVLYASKYSGFSWYRPWRPNLIYPSRDAQNVPVPISFKWSMDYPANAGGVLTVATDSLLHNAVDLNGTVSTPQPLLPRTTYYWSVMLPGEGMYNPRPDIYSDTATFTTGDFSSVLSDTTTSGYPMLLRYIEGAPTLQYNLLSSGVLRIAAVDILGRLQPLLETPLTSTRGTLSIPHFSNDFPLLFYTVSVGDARWVLRAVSKP